MKKALASLLLLLTASAAVAARRHETTPLIRALSRSLQGKGEPHRRRTDEKDEKECGPTANDPVDCTLEGLPYQTLCLAVADGQDPSDCTAPRWKVEQAGEAPAKACPPVPEAEAGNTTSTDEWISCSGMIFDSICLASVSEFVPKTECIPYRDDPAVQIQLRLERCRSRPVRPVLCRKAEDETQDPGEEEEDGEVPSPPIEYENFCYARVDGYKWADCARKARASAFSALGVANP
jgi:hypothetical protein